MVFNGEGCATIVEKKKKGKEMRRKENEENGVAQAWLNLNSAPLSSV